MRRFNSYEINHLLRFGYDPFTLSLDIDENIPVEYITGKVEFSGNIFKINNKVLIPRIESEELVELGYKYLINDYKIKQKIYFTDLATGSGCIGISIIKKLIEKGFSVDAVLSDISADALSICKANIENLLDKELLNYTNSTILILKSDLFSLYPDNVKFNLITANLPYIPANRIHLLDKSVKYEPLIALDGGIEGLELIRDLLKVIPKYLKYKSEILLEVDDSHTNVKEFFTNWKIEILADSFKKNRFWRIYKV